METMWIVKVKHSPQDLVVNTGHVNNNCKQSLGISRNAIPDSPDWVRWAKWRKVGWASGPAQPEAVSFTGLGSGVVCAPVDLPYDPAKRFSWVVSPASLLTMGELLPLLLAWAQTLWPKAATLPQQLPFQRPNITILFPTHKNSSQTLCAVTVGQRASHRPSPKPKITGLVWAGELFFNVGTLFGVIFVLVLPFGSKQSNWRSRYINIPHQAHGFSSSLGNHD